MLKTSALPVLTDKVFHLQSIGGLFVGFTGGNIRNAHTMGWIHGMKISDDSKKFIIVLQPNPIVKKEDAWVKLDHPEIVVDLSSPIEQISFIDGGERHFIPSGENHFSIYNPDVLVKSNEGLLVLEQYKEMYKEAKLITRV